MTKATTGKNGRRGGTIFISTGRRALLGPRTGLARRTFNIRDGEPGEDRNGCDQIGGKGGRGGKLFLYAGGWRLKSIDFVGGNGGRGGDAGGMGCADGNTNMGGSGAKPGTMKIRASRYIVIDGLVSFTGFDSGDGGAADISGVPTASVHAEGGAAASITGYRMVATGLSFATAASSMTLDVLHGGFGGNASAFAGDGTCVLPAARGGHASAAGGTAADVQLTTVTLPNGADATGSFAAGFGGDAMAIAGIGGHGADCDQFGTDGAPGGDGTAAGAPAGVSSHGEDGDPGRSDDAGGRGGDGGNGIDPDQQRCQSFGGHGAPGGHAGNGLAGDGGHGGDGICMMDFTPFVLGFGGNGGSGGDSLFGDGGNGGNAGCLDGQAGPGGVGLLSDGIHGAGC